MNRDMTADFRFSENKLAEVCNSELIPLNNFVIKLADMIDDYACGVLDSWIKAKHYNWVLGNELENYARDIESLRFDRALHLVQKIIQRINLKIIEEQTWKLESKNQEIISTLKG